MRPHAVLPTIPASGQNTGGTPEAIVEIAFLLPTERAESLFHLAQKRRESVGQILRRLVEQELQDAS